jgi:putative transposase
MMIRKENTNLSLKRQCKLFNITRSSTYYTPVGLDQAKIDLMHEIDRIFTEYPFWQPSDCRLLTLIRAFGRTLPRASFDVHHGRAGHLQGSKYQQETSVANIWLNLLQKLLNTRSNQVWCSNITYIAVEKGFLYLDAIMDRVTR